MNDEDRKLVEKIKTRLSYASGHDRRYEKPMSWEDAYRLILILERLDSKLDRLFRKESSPKPTNS